MSVLPELLERFRRGPELVAVAITGAAGSELDFAPGPGKWTVRQILCHLSDSELVAAGRFRQLIAEDNPTLGAYDQNAWAEKLDYSRRKISQALESFRRLRSQNYELLKELPEAVFERTGVHAERGTTSLLRLLQVYAEHAEKHTRQLQYTRERFRESRSRS